MILWMVIIINGHIAGVHLNQGMPPYMSLEECEASALMHTLSPEAKRRGARYECLYDYGRPLLSGPYDEGEME